MNKENDVREAFAVQAKWCLKLNSPLTARLMAGLGQSLDRHTRTGKTVLVWPGDGVERILATGDAHGREVNWSG